MMTVGESVVTVVIDDRIEINAMKMHEILMKTEPTILRNLIGYLCLRRLICRHSLCGSER